jgi:hypothetical protein
MFYIFESYSLDTDRRELCRGGDIVALQPQVFDLLQYLIVNRGRVVSKEDMLEAVWGGRLVSGGKEQGQQTKPPRLMRSSTRKRPSGQQHSATK